MTPAQHAIDTLIRTSTDGETDVPLTAYEAAPSPEMVQQITHDWESFREQAEALGFDAEEHCARMLPLVFERDAWAAAAHDFILTRNHEGTGFWDTGRWHQPWAQRLTDLAYTFPGISCTIDVDNLIYVF